MKMNKNLVHLSLRKLCMTWCVRSTFRRYASIVNDKRKESSWTDLAPVNNAKKRDKFMSQYYSPSSVEFGYSRHNRPQSDNSDTFSMILPPPNVTGSLHLGHALTLAIQDAIAVWHQMNGKVVNWIPGCDHAGIATQVRVEQLLTKQKHIHRHQITSADLNEHILDWKLEQERAIFHQINSLGSSLSFDKSYFTLDHKTSNAVIEAFVRLYDMNLIYRNSRLVNWCCFLQSAVSDIEVEQLAINEPKDIKVPGYEESITFGYMYYFSYKVHDEDAEIVVATTWPETMLGDVAVAVNPNDSRFANFHGKYVRHPFTGTLLPILLDDSVDREFGSGAVKITPAHDSNDYEIGIKHELIPINVIDDAGLIELENSEFNGLSRYVARKKVVDALSDLGSLKKVSAHQMSIPICTRSGDVIEQRLKPQWYLKSESLSQKAVESVKNGELELLPKHHEATWYEWLKNLDDWCISRQLSWGHRVPMFKVNCSDNSQEKWICARNHDEAMSAANEQFGANVSVEQDPDVLDTWFSSALIPAIAFGWPDAKTPDFKSNYPLSLMETGYDIIFFWVARMVMLCTALTGQLPFNKVLLHGLIVDENGKKMSKSVGNIIDPEDVTKGASLDQLHSRIDKSVELGYMTNTQAQHAKDNFTSNFPSGIPECGSDGLRNLLLSNDIKEQQITLEYKQLANCRQLINKIWQVARLFNELYNREPFDILKLDGLNLTNIERWICHKTLNLVQNTRYNYDNLRLDLAVKNIEAYWFDYFSSTYLECIKPLIYSEADRVAALSVYLTCMRTALLCSTPIIPFLCDDLNFKLPDCRFYEPIDDVRFAPYPKVETWEKYCNPEINDQISDVMSTVKIIRDYKSQVMELLKKVEINVKNVEDPSAVIDNLEYVKILSKYANVYVNEETSSDNGNVLKRLVKNLPVNAYIDDVNANEYKEKLRERARSLKKKLEKVEKMINNKGFLEKAPEHVQQQKKQKHEQLLVQFNAVTQLLEKFK